MVKSSQERKAKGAKSQLKTIKGSAHSLNVSNRTAKQASGPSGRTAGTVKRLQMYRNFKVSA